MQHKLRIMDLSKPFILQVAASHDRFGTVLLQKVEVKKSPMAYASRTLKASEQAYAVIEKECLVLGQVWYLIVSIPDLCNLITLLWSGEFRNFTGIFMVQLSLWKLTTSR